MTSTTRLVAEGADRFRRPGTIERLASHARRLPVSSVIRRQLKRLYHLTLTIQTRGKGLARVLPGGEVIRVLPEYEDLSWNPDEYRAFRDAVRPGMVALDIGANLGAYSTLLGRWIGPTGSVFAFEPAPQPFDGLRRHVRLNDLAGVVTPVHSAVGESLTPAALLLADTSGESRLAGTADRADRTMRVPVTTVDEFCARERIAPDFIKVDVEGGELSVLRGARETIRARRGRLALFVEMHPSIWPSLALSREDLLAELRAQSLDPVPLVPTAEVWSIEGMCVRLVAR